MKKRKLENLVRLCGALYSVSDPTENYFHLSLSQVALLYLTCTDVSFVSFS